MTPETQLTIERLTEPSLDDRAAILALESASFSNPWTRETFDTMLATHVSRLYVARDHTRIVAFCACRIFDDELHINTLAVDETRRRQGIARTLLRDVLERTGAQRATLEVRRSNVAALRLYEALGFTVTAVRPRYYEKPEEDGLILWMNP